MPAPSLPGRRKAALRARPDWLDALSLPDDAADAAPVDPSWPAPCGWDRAAPARLAGPLAPNAAERWAATLPTASDLAIAAERRRRDERPTARPAATEPAEREPALGPLPPFRTAWQEARRNALACCAAVAALAAAWHWIA